MPGLFKTLSNLIRGSADDLSKKLADPERDAKIAIADSKKQIGGFTAKIASLLAETKKLERQCNDARADQDKYLGIAKKAMAAGNEADARGALEHKVRAQQRCETLEIEADKNKKLTGHLRDELAKARAKIGNAEGNLRRLAARSEGAKIRTELAKASSAFNSGDNPLAALDDLQNAVDASEAEAEAWEELSAEDTGSVQALEEKYGGGTDVIDVAFEELKALTLPAPDAKRLPSETPQGDKS